MTIYCDACETELGMEKSKCCKADVWVELRADGTRYICKGCDNDCECDVIMIVNVKK